MEAATAGPTADREQAVNTPLPPPVPRQAHSERDAPFPRRLQHHHETDQKQHVTIKIGAAPGFTHGDTEFSGSVQERSCDANLGKTRAILTVKPSLSRRSLETAHDAETIARHLAAVPGSVHSANAAGCHRLLKEGCAALVADAAELSKLLAS